MKPARSVLIIVVGVLATLPGAFAADSREKSASQQELPKYLQDFDALQRDLEKKIRPLREQREQDYLAARTEKERDEKLRASFAEEERIFAQAVPKGFAIIRAHAADPEAVEPLVWVAQNGDPTIAGAQAAALLIQHHLMSPPTLDLAIQMSRMDVAWVGKILRAQVASPDLPERQRPNQMRALGDYYQRMLNQQKGDAAKIEVEAVALYTELGKKYGRMQLAPGISMGDVAKSSIFEIQHLGIGKKAPEIDGEDLEGVPFKLSDYRGKVVMVSFWGSWCGPCMGFVPHERELVERYAGRPFALVGVNSDQDLDALKPVLKKNGITWRSFWCGEMGPGGPIPRSWNVAGWPTVYVIDAAGVIRSKTFDPVALDGVIEKLVAEAERR